MNVGTLHFTEPLFLWLLAGPGCLLVLWTWRLLIGRVEIRRLRRERFVPIDERHGPGGELAFWASVILATTLCIVAAAQPQKRVSVVRNEAADVVLLQDGSASMYARDVEPTRWQRSIRFVRTFADTLGWNGDRVALALFAHLASPQVRLTSDPNALFFFLDHLGEQSPFRLEDDTTWDTNIEEGLRWGLKLIDKDQEVYGRSTNLSAFVVISDGQAWSGAVANAVAAARQRSIPIYVVGVGTTGGAFIPQPVPFDGREPEPPVRAILDRDSLREIAHAGGGNYFELGREPDRDVASKILSDLRRRSRGNHTVDSYGDLYWWFLLTGGISLCLGTMALRSITELWWQAAAALAATSILWSILSLP